MKRNLFTENIHFALYYTAARLLFLLIFSFTSFLFSQSSKNSSSGIVVVGKVTIINHQQPTSDFEQNQIKTRSYDGIVAYGDAVIIESDGNKNIGSTQKKAPELDRKQVRLSEAVAKNAERIREIIKRSSPKPNYFFINTENAVVFNFGNSSLKNKATSASTHFLAKAKYTYPSKDHFNTKELELAFILKSYLHYCNNKEKEVLCTVFVRPPPKRITI